MEIVVIFRDLDKYPERQWLRRYVKDSLDKNIGEFEIYDKQKVQYELAKLKATLFAHYHHEMFYHIDEERQRITIEVQALPSASHVSISLKFDLDDKEGTRMEKVHSLVMEARGEINSVIPFIRDKEIEDALQVAKQKLDEADKVSTIKDKFIIQLLDQLSKLQVNADQEIIGWTKENQPEIYTSLECLINHYVATRKNNK